MNMGNIIDDLLYYLEVKHTNYFVNKLYNEHPHNKDMYGLKDMLNVYNIESVGVDIKDKDEANMVFPSIYHVENNFVIAIECHDEKISFLSGGKISETHIYSFKKAWDGKTLVITSTEHAKEENYLYNLGLEWVIRLSWLCLIFVPVIFIILSFLYNPIMNTYFNIPLLLLDVIGCTLCYLLLQKKIKDSAFGERFCSMITEKGCDAVLSSERSMIFYIFSWSEIGLAYFLVNAVIISFVPQYLSGLILVNYIAMTYGIWSVWYQYKRIRKWCTLCLSVQLVIWIMGLYYSLLYKDVLLFSKVITPLFVVTCSIVSFTVAVHYLIKSYHDTFIITSMLQKLKSFQVDNDVLKAKYMKEQEYTDASNISSIFWGDINALQQITIVLNPHCGHCKDTFKKIVPLLRKQNLRMGIRLIFLSFGSAYDDACKLLIAAYYKQDKEIAINFYSKWFDNISQDVDALAQSFNLDINYIDITREYENHKHWTKENKINKTPSILINSHLLPAAYKIEDLEKMDEI